MAFARLQGNTIRILHSRRQGKKVRHQEIYCFGTCDFAWKTVQSNVRWKAAAMAMLLELGRDAAEVESMDKLRTQITELLKDSPWFKHGGDAIKTAAAGLKDLLLNIDRPLSEPAVEALREAREELQFAKGLIETKLRLLDRHEAGRAPIVDDTQLAADELLDKGMEFYWAGHWQEAQKYYLAGLQVAPEHVDLNVHAGLCCLLAEQLVEALVFFDRAYELGMAELRRMMAKTPEDFMWREDWERKWAEVQIPEEGEFPDDISDAEWQRYDDLRDQRETDAYKIPSRRWIEFRPLCRAAGNKIHTLQQLGRHEDAIRFALEVRKRLDYEIDRDIGYSYMCLAEYEAAAHWSEHAEPIQKAFIQLMRNDKTAFLQQAFEMLCTRPLLVAMLAGHVRPEPERCYAQSSQFSPCGSCSNTFHDQQIYSQNGRFRDALRFVTDFEDIQPVFAEVVDHFLDSDSDSIQLQQEARDRFPAGAERRDLIARMAADWENPRHEHWLPPAGAELNVAVLERKQLHWLVQLSGSGRKFHYRISGDDWLAAADRGVITVRKAWRHRRRLYATGVFASEPGSAAGC